VTKRYYNEALSEKIEAIKVQECQSSYSQTRVAPCNALKGCQSKVYKCRAWVCHYPVQEKSQDKK
jgi:hypothetical protein